MGRRSWILFVYSKDTAEKIKSFCEISYDLIFIRYYVIINGSIESEYFMYGKDSDKTPAILTQSEGNQIVRDMVDHKIIDFDDYICLDNINRKELEDTGDGYKIKKATYLSEKNFYELLENESFPKRWIK